MKYLEKFESEVLYHQIGSFDDFASNDIINISDKVVKILNDYIKSKPQFPAGRIINKRNSLLMSITAGKRGCDSIYCTFYKTYDSNQVEFDINIAEYSDDWFYVGIALYKRNLDKNSPEYRLWIRISNFNFKCDTIQGVIQALDNHVVKELDKYDDVMKTITKYIK